MIHLLRYVSIPSRTIAVAGAAMLYAVLSPNTSGSVPMPPSPPPLRLEVAPGSGRISLTDPQGRPLIENATVAVNLPTTTILAAAPRFSARLATTSSQEALLPGQQSLVSFDDALGELALELHATVLSDRPGVVFELKSTNLGTTDVELRSLEPLRAVTAENGACRFACSKVLTNGRIYYDPGRLLEFSSVQSTEVDSFWNAAFHAPESGETLVAGFLDNREGEGHIIARRGGSPAFELSGASHFHSRLLLKPGATISSGRLLLLLSPDGFSGLETYADLTGRLHNTRLNPVLNGWCSWFPYYGSVSEEEVLRNAEFIARELKPYGMDWVQIDDGFQRSFADWEGVPDRFPRGMKGAADGIRKLGLKAGLWLAPYAVSAHSPLAKEHPEWLVHRPNGEIQRIVDVHQGQAQYILDATHPGARQWLHDLLRTATEEWGYDFIKTDFCEWTLLAAERYHDPSVSTSKAYRIAVEAMREGMGPDRHMLDCGPGPVAVGLIDSMRIELDRPTPENPLWDQYAGYYNSTGPAVAKRYYFHNRTWINDADHLRLGGLTPAQGKAAATITALAGGTMISGDNLYKLDAERVEILKRVLPAYGKAARPLDLFATDSAELFHLPIREPWGAWEVLGCFNWGTLARERLLDFAALGLTDGKPSLVYDYWSQQLAGETTGLLTLKQEPTSVHLLSVHAKSGKPQLLGTDRHFTQGAVELKDVRWNEETQSLSGIALGSPGMSWRMAVYVPEEYAPHADKATGVVIDQPESQPRVLQATVRFDGSSEVPWHIGFANTAQLNPAAN